jgi:membrane protease YdiL (CAAX protease family)
MASYWQSTRHPGPCLLFLTPLLVAYEVGVISLGGGLGVSLRNGADAWLRAGLEAIGGGHPAVAPVALVVGLTIWLWRRRGSTPEDLPGLCLGMTLESVAGALVLWAVSRSFSPLLEAAGVSLAVDSPPLSAAPFGQVVTYVGAGIYEEVMFRLVLFGGLCAVLQVALVPKRPAVALAAVVAAVLFAAAHHIGPHGEPVDGYNFLFRVLAGLYFTLLYLLRGVGIAVGAHACYDVLVGIRM